MRYYVVSDVHGYYDQLMAALEEKGYFKDEQPHKLIVCGDLFDRGDKPRELEKFIDGLLKDKKVVLIRGNHEDLMVELADNAYKWFNTFVQASHHWHNGTVATMLALTDTSLEDACAHPDVIADRIYNTPFFKNILPNMVDYFETKHFVFVHGWIPCHASGFGGKANYFEYEKNWRNMTKEDWYFARWYNGMRAYSQGVRERGKTIVCGHWHASYGHSVIEGKGSEFEEDANFTPFTAKGIIALDACTAHSGFINCVVIED